ncbi:MAG: RluA family pseudouridine synthase [Bdellovibrionota bacterium]
MLESAKRTPEILFENEHFIAVDKPAGWLSVFSRMGEKETRPVVGVFLEKKINKPIFPCHRLDVEVQGVLLYAKTKEAHALSQKWFENRIIVKSYLAITHGKCQDRWSPDIPRKILKDELDPGKTWTWKTQMSRGKRRAYEDARGLQAITEATFLKQNGDNCFWKLSPLTGRSHQLRLEMALRGFVIKGDELYGSTDEHEDGIDLQAWQLNLKNVTEKDRMGLPLIVACQEPLFHV